jgi:hypothetical protein
MKGCMSRIRKKDKTSFFFVACMNIKMMLMNASLLFSCKYGQIILNDICAI